MAKYIKKILRKMAFFVGLLKPLPFDFYVSVFYFILAAAFLVRTANINYNSAFNDEAIYIVIGRMGLFTSDWWSYGAKLWMAGVPYIYPTLTALAYETGGLIASRFLNVIFGVLLIEEVYRLTNLLNLFSPKINRRAAIIAAFFAAFSAIGIFVSKLATYDMASFLFLVIGINSFLKAKHFLNGKYYFLTFLCVFTAFLTKIVIAVFFPILFLLSLFVLRARAIKQRKLAVIYLYIPFLLCSLLYLYFYRDNLITYVFTHKSLGKAENYFSIPLLIWRETGILLLLFLPSALLLVKSGKVKALAALTMLAAAIPVFHYALSRYATLDKHLNLTVVFLSVIAGYGLSFLLSSKSDLLKKATKVLLPIIAVLYLLNSYQILKGHEQDWKNTAALQNYLKQNVQPGERILTEEGGVVILALYDKIFPPTNIATFDWIDYSGFKDERGYIQAVDDVYFDYIELDENYVGDDSLKARILKSMGSNYSLAYEESGFRVFRKNEN
ncbi:MAG: hypothetical protein Q7S42_05200 [Candidatus Omnitrophota bacterium]|nr:hypothetical protein [Candidatus Omnitrophota bacterium]